MLHLRKPLETMTFLFGMGRAYCQVDTVLIRRKP